MLRGNRSGQRAAAAAHAPRQPTGSLCAPDVATTRVALRGRRLVGGSCNNRLWLAAVAAQPQALRDAGYPLPYHTLTLSPHQVDLGAGVAARARALVHAPVLGVELVVGQQGHLAKALLRCAPSTQGAVTRAALTSRKFRDDRLRCHQCYGWSKVQTIQLPKKKPRSPAARDATSRLAASCFCVNLTGGLQDQLAARVRVVSRMHMRNATRTRAARWT